MRRMAPKFDQLYSIALLRGKHDTHTDKDSVMQFQLESVSGMPNYIYILLDKMRFEAMIKIANL